MRVVTLGTAGHIDHGKTALVRALTGIDTDRLPEEKRRGITIDLGFAHVDLAPDLRLAITDVPGHEAFVRNMTAGASGIDLGLLVVAADEGIMPQTREHLAILELLAVAPAAIALTKADLVEPDWLELVEEDIRRELSGAYAHAPIVPVSSKTGQGIDQLRAVLIRAADGVLPRNADDHFRLPVDRVFSVRGTGTVVTGTVWTGELASDQIVRLLPSGATARVRGLQRQGESADKVRAGDRAAIALANIPVESIERGETLVMHASWNPARSFTAAVRQLPSAERPLKTRQRVHVYLGTASVLARVYPINGPIEPGQENIALFYLEKSIALRAGDRFIVRSYSPVTTIAGGEVLEWSDRPYRRRSAQSALLNQLRSKNLHERCEAAVALAGWIGMPVDQLPLRVPGAHGNSESTGFVAGGRCYDLGLISEAETEILGALDRLHRDQPHRDAVDTEQLRSAIPRRIATTLREALLQRLVGSGKILERPDGIASADWKPKVNPHHEKIRAALLEILNAAGLTPPDRDHLASSLGTDVPELLRGLIKDGSVVAVSREFFMSRAAVEVAEKKIRLAMATQALSVPELKAVLGVSRKHLIPLLEHFDRVGITRRNGDLRILERVETVSDMRDATV
jgi:selenocysteine-specific elongation factor